MGRANFASAPSWDTQIRLHPGDCGDFLAAVIFVVMVRRRGRAAAMGMAPAQTRLG